MNVFAQEFLVKRKHPREEADFRSQELQARLAEMEEQMLRLKAESEAQLAALRAESEAQLASAQAHSEEQMATLKTRMATFKAQCEARVQTAQTETARELAESEAKMAQSETMLAQSEAMLAETQAEAAAKLARSEARVQKLQQRMKEAMYRMREQQAKVDAAAATSSRLEEAQGQLAMQDSAMSELLATVDAHNHEKDHGEGKVEVLFVEFHYYLSTVTCLFSPLKFCCVLLKMTPRKVDGRRLDEVTDVLAAALSEHIGGDR